MSSSKRYKHSPAYEIPSTAITAGPMMDEFEALQALLVTYEEHTDCVDDGVDGDGSSYGDLDFDDDSGDYSGGDDFDGGGGESDGW